eukprot:5593-Heterococcus_DN1.PRE.8
MAGQLAHTYAHCLSTGLLLSTDTSARICITVADAAVLYAKGDNCLMSYEPPPVAVAIAAALLLAILLKSMLPKICKYCAAAAIVIAVATATATAAFSLSPLSRDKTSHYKTYCCLQLS